VWAASPVLGENGSDSFIIKHWQTDEGLPQNSVTSILQDQTGYLWLGTLNGLVRFDGDRLTVFDENNTPGLNSSRIVSLFEDRAGHLWVGTETAGIARIKDGKVTTYEIGQGVTGKCLAAACQDAAGAVWLYTRDGQLWRQANEKFTVFSFGLDRPGAYRAAVAETGGPVWIATDARLSAIGPNASPGPLEHQVQQDARLTRLDFLAPSRSGGYWRLADNRIQKWRSGAVERDLGPYPWPRFLVAAACEDEQGNLVLGTLGTGILWYQTNGVPIQVAKKDGLSHDIVLSLCFDREGNLWAGTDGGGLNRIKRRTFALLDQRHGLPAPVIQSVCEDAQGGVWIGSNGGGLTYLKERQLRNYGREQGLLSLHVYSVFVDRSQRVWAGTWGGGLLWQIGGRFERVPGAERLNPVVLAIHQDRLGSLWFGTQGGLARWQEGEWQLFTHAEGLPGNEVRAIAEDWEGSLWLGTVGGGLARFRDGQFNCFRKSDGLPSDDLSSLLVDSEGVLWIGTYGGGLGCLREGKFTRFTMREGLASNSIGPLLDDGQGCLWLCSNVGLMRLRKADLQELARSPRAAVHCRVYARPDGLPTRECTLGSQPGAARTQDGRLWFPTTKGLVAVHPTQLRDNPHPPPVVIESALLDGQDQKTNLLQTGISRALQVPPGTERLEIRYTALCLSAPDRARFRYRLEGYETSWIEAGAGRSAHYSRIAPGDYRFGVIACNEDGVWSKVGRGLAITVAPPFWRTWWFLSLAAVVSLGAVAFTVYFLSTQRLQRQLEHARQKEALEKERTRIARDIHDQLGASVTQITFLSELAQSDKDTPAEVEAHARQISHTARSVTRTLDEIVWAVNPANDTLEGLLTYVSKYAQEYLSAAGLRCRLEAPAELPALPVPPDVRHHTFLAFKEAVTNVVRHAGATAVWVRLRLEPAAFILEVQDNGRGIADLNHPAVQARNGLRNMRKRLEEINGQFFLGPAPETGALVRLTVPFRGFDARGSPG
jgi:ligand-binding sensor domain-containing protein/signal transduction histidine kinase